MCNWCMEHGEGEKWYLNIKNYAKELWEDEEAVQQFHKILKERDKEDALDMAKTLKRLEDPQEIP